MLSKGCKAKKESYMRQMWKTRLNFLCLQPLPLNRNINLSNSKTKAILLSTIIRSIARLSLLLLILLSLKYEE